MGCFDTAPTETMESDESRDRVNLWRVIRWLGTTAAALVLATIFLSQASPTEAAAPVPNVAACQAGNYYACTYNIGVFGNWNNGVAWNNGYIWGNGVNWVYPSYVAPANYGLWNGCNVYLCRNF